MRSNVLPGCQGPRKAPERAGSSVRAVAAVIAAVVAEIAVRCRVVGAETIVAPLHMSRVSRAHDLRRYDPKPDSDSESNPHSDSDADPYSDAHPDPNADGYADAYAAACYGSRDRCVAWKYRDPRLCSATGPGRCAENSRRIA